MPTLTAAVLVLAILGATKNPNYALRHKYSSAQIKRGEYFVNSRACNDCHTPHVMTPQGPGPDMSRFLSGAPNNEMVPNIPETVASPGGWMGLMSADMTTWGGPWGVSFSSNLTPDSATGIGSWTEKIFISAIRNGKYWGNGRDLLPPMPWQLYRNMTDNDLRDIYAYLMSIKPVSNVVPHRFRRSIRD